MICFRCDNEIDFEVREIDVIQEYLGNTLTVHTPVTMCLKCGFTSLDLGQTNKLMERMKLKLLEYPIETEGSRIARKAREKCNKMTPEERKFHFEEGMKIINGKYTV